MSYASEALEKQVEGVEYLDACMRDPSLRVGSHEQERHLWRTEYLSLIQATPFYWNDNTVQLVKNLQDDFRLEDIEVKRHLLYTDHAWHYFSGKPLMEIEEYKTKRMIPVKALTWRWFTVDNLPYLGITAWAPSLRTHKNEPAGCLGPFLWCCVDEGMKLSEQIEGDRLAFEGYVDDKTREEILAMKKFVAATSTFLRQRLLVLSAEQIERHARKRLAARGWNANYVATVHLRRTERRESETSEEHTQRDYKWQWTVRGHVRQQWYASLQEHLPVYIHQHVKGPEGAPLKPRTTPILAVVR